MTDLCNITNKNSTCILATNHPGRHFDANSGHSWLPSSPPVNDSELVELIDETHRSHCCSVHGCKYATDQEQENACPVSNGTLQQAHPCEHCEFQAEGLRQATDAQIVDELHRRGYSDAALLVQ
jgi:hypothetical protein